MTSPLEQCRDALEAARNGLLWYRDAFPSADSQADDEMAADIDAALSAADAALVAQPEPVAWLCELAMEDGTTRTQFVTEDPAGLRWNDAGEPSPYRTTPLYAAPVAARTGLTPIGDLVQMPDGTVMHKDDATAPATAQMDPLTDAQIDAEWAPEARAGATTRERQWFDEGIKFAERTHGIAPKEPA